MATLATPTLFTETAFTEPAAAQMSQTRQLNPRAAVAVKAASRRRQMTPQSGRAIEMLGHAIEYLADEFMLECMEWKGSARPSSSLSGIAAVHPRVAAIELLKARNREIYLSCPVVPTLAERLRALLHLQRA